jgi:hypothetical protein
MAVDIILNQRQRNSEVSPICIPFNRLIVMHDDDGLYTLYLLLGGCQIQVILRICMCW